MGEFGPETKTNVEIHKQSLLPILIETRRVFSKHCGRLSTKELENRQEGVSLECDEIKNYIYLLVTWSLSCRIIVGHEGKEVNRINKICKVFLQKKSSL